ncbi:MAG: aminotransferase class V-fold PLP-dependent enzyme [Candidatus Sericytochromatia bacterium]|nr:aminotransferase class V-fold PLP-dependent enzyme [Candidatus Sericytochromatia bacterium]
MFLNHGSFGACPSPVLAEQSVWRERMERQPLRFLGRELEGLLDQARGALAAFVGADPAGLVFVANATTGVATVVACLRLTPGDELLTTTHVYPAVRHVLRRAAERSGARLVEVPLPFPLTEAEAITQAVLQGVTPRTRLAVLDHLTSPTALRFPLESLVPALRARGVETLVDGAHAPGQIPLDLTALGAAYYVGNCHKWLGAPKGAAFLSVRPDCEAGIVPLVASRGAYSPRTDRPRLHLEFDWVGTTDPTAVLSIPAALAAHASLLPGGWPALMERNHRLALAAQAVMAEALGLPDGPPAALLGAMAALPLPPDPTPLAAQAPFHSVLQTDLLAAGFEVPLFHHPAHPERVIRVSAFAYNHLAQYRALAAALLDMVC